MNEPRAQAGNVDRNGDVVDCLLERLRCAIDPDAATAEALDHARRIRDELVLRRQAAAALERGTSWVSGSASG